MARSLREATEQKLLEIAKQLAEEAGLNWEKLPELEKQAWKVEASFCYNWLVE